MKIAVLEDPLAAVEAAIRDPIGAAPLWEIVEPGQTVAFVIYEPARPSNTHVFLPALIEEIHAVGAPYEDMCIVFAVGSHNAMTEAEMRGEVGEWVASRLKLYSGEIDFYSDQRVAAVKHVILSGSVTIGDITSTERCFSDTTSPRRPSFLINVVLDEENRILKVFAGNYILAHKEACTFVEELRQNLLSGA